MTEWNDLMGQIGGKAGEIDRPKKPRTARQKGPTIRTIEATKKAAIREDLKKIKEFELDILTAPGKPVRSVGKLKEKLDEFFKKHMDDPYVTFNELAVAVGFSDEDALAKAMNDMSLPPQYIDLLRKAYSIIESLMTRRMLYVADQKNDVKGYAAALDRAERKMNKYDPAAKEANTSLNIAVKVQESEEIKNLVADRIGALMNASRGPVIDITPKSIPEPVPVPVSASKSKEAEDGE